MAAILSQPQCVNSSPPSATYMHQWTGSALVQVMACHLFGAKPLPELMLPYCQLHSWQQISVKFKSEFYHFHSRNCIWNCRLPKWRPFCQLTVAYPLCSTHIKLLLQQLEGAVHIVQMVNTHSPSLRFLKKKKKTGVVLTKWQQNSFYMQQVIRY